MRSHSLPGRRSSQGSRTKGGRAHVPWAPGAAATVLATALLAACGGHGPKTEPAAATAPGPPPAAITLATAKTLAAGSAKTTVAIHEAANGTTATGEGVLDARAGRVRLAVVDGSDEPGSFIFDRTTAYVQLPPDEASDLPGGKPWLEIDLISVVNAADRRLQSLAKTSGVDPTQAFAFMNGFAGDTREVGKEILRGGQTTHYRGTLDLRRAMGLETAKQPAARDAGAQLHLRQALRQAVLPSFPADAWIDAEGRLTKLRYEFAVRGPDGKDASRIGTIEFHDFGLPVAIHLPPADQVFDLSKFLAGLQAPKPAGGS